MLLFTASFTCTTLINRVNRMCKTRQQHFFKETLQKWQKKKEKKIHSYQLFNDFKKLNYKNRGETHCYDTAQS